MSGFQDEEVDTTTTNVRPKIAPIKSLRAVTYGCDPKDLSEDSDHPSLSPARRKPSERRQRAARGNFDNSVSYDRQGRGGLAATNKKLSASFSDMKGFSASDMGSILSRFQNEKDEEVDTTTTNVRPKPKLATIHSLSSVNFGFDPKDLLEDSDEDFF